MLAKYEKREINVNNLEYDSFYKFFVSLGIVLFLLPIAIAVFHYFAEPILISQNEFEALSDFSINMINQRIKLSTMVNVAFPWIAIISPALGLLFFIIGLFKWRHQQKVLDNKIAAEAKIQQLTVLQMSNAEVFEKVEKEVKEDLVIEKQDRQATIDNNRSRIKKYYEVEDLCFDFFVKKYHNKYDFRRNIKIRRCEYDFIGVSQTDNIDLLFEIKYYNNPNVINLHSILSRLNASGVNYESVVHRNYRCFAVFVTTTEQLQRLKSIVESFCRSNAEFINGIQIMCFSEDDVK